MNTTTINGLIASVTNSLREEARQHAIDMNKAETVSYTVVSFKLDGMDKEEAFDIRVSNIGWKGAAVVDLAVLGKIEGFESTKNVSKEAKELLAAHITEHIARMNWASLNNKANGTFRNTVSKDIEELGADGFGYFTASTYVHGSGNLLDIPLHEEHARRQAVLGTIAIPA